MDLPLGGQLYLDAMSKLRKFPAISCLQIINDIGVKKKNQNTELSETTELTVEK